MIGEKGFKIGFRSDSGLNNLLQLAEQCCLCILVSHKHEASKSWLKYPIFLFSNNADFTLSQFLKILTLLYYVRKYLNLLNDYGLIMGILNYGKI